ncbi:hypothetical protein M5K25_023098 [Dendrobium thyrsiflorum]|uniref:Uncharacterized protein n=1 Tax=Dendrobium thyrsiflorum TaxID=117978 RepID=A0ABD0U7V4_DENTH
MAVDDNGRDGRRFRGRSERWLGHSVFYGLVCTSEGECAYEYVSLEINVACALWCFWFELHNFKQWLRGQIIVLRKAIEWTVERDKAIVKATTMLMRVLLNRPGCLSVLGTCMVIWMHSHLHAVPWMVADQVSNIVTVHPHGHVDIPF